MWGVERGGCGHFILPCRSLSVHSGERYKDGKRVVAHLHWRRRTRVLTWTRIPVLNRNKV